MPTAAPTATPDARPVPARIRVFHNNRDSREYCTGFMAGHSVTEVYAYVTTRARQDTPDADLADEAFHMLNVGDDPDFGEIDTRAVVYRKLRNRSLSIGDVIAVDDTFYSCDSNGWTHLETTPPLAQQPTYGTTPLY